MFLLFIVACKKKEAPKAPTEVTSYVSETSIVIEWNKVEDANSYVVTDGDGYTLGTVSFHSDYDPFLYTYIDSHPHQGGNEYRVYSKNEYGISSSYGSTYCYYFMTPDAPTGLSAEVSGTMVRVSWNSVPNADVYYIYWSSTSDGEYVCGWETSNTYIYDDVPSENNYYKVKAGNDYGTSPFSSQVYCHYSNGGGGGSTTLDAPTGVSASLIGTYVHVTWNSVSGASSYRVYRASSSSGPYSFLGTGGVAAQFNDNDPMANNYYKVTSVRSDGSESEMSSYAYCYYSNGGGGGSITPNPPTNVSASVSGTRIRVSWSYVSDASSYRVYRSSSSYGTYTLLGSSSYSYYYDDAPLSDNYYKVTSVGSDGSESEMSSYTYCQYSGGGGGGSVPDAPTGVSATVSGTKIKVSWNSVSNATEYLVYWSNTGSNYDYCVGTTSNTYIYDDNPYEDNYYKVKAKNSNGESSFSSYAYCHYSSGGGGGGGSSNYEPCPPSVTVTGSSTCLTVKWTASTGSGCGTPTGYKVYKRDPHTSQMELLKTVSSSTTSYKDYDVHPGLNRYAVKATNSHGDSEPGYGYSSSIPLSKPSSFTAQKYQNTYIRCSWSKVEKATGYQISLSTSSSSTYVWTEIDNVNTTTTDIYYPASSGTTVYLKIQAVFRADYAGDPIYSGWTTYKTVTF